MTIAKNNLIICCDSGYYDQYIYMAMYSTVIKHSCMHTKCSANVVVGSNWN